MNATTQATPETVNARLTRDVTYLLNGEAVPELLARLERMCELAIGEGLLTGETAAEVDTCTIDTTEVPSAADRETPEPEIADFIQQRTEDGNLREAALTIHLHHHALVAHNASAHRQHEHIAHNHQ